MRDIKFRVDLIKICHDCGVAMPFGQFSIIRINFNADPMDIWVDLFEFSC